MVSVTAQWASHGFDIDLLLDRSHSLLQFMQIGGRHGKVRSCLVGLCQLDQTFEISASVPEESSNGGIGPVRVVFSDRRCMSISF